jgi:RNA polymerase sigma-70 factor (ECF subfamily)
MGITIEPALVNGGPGVITHDAQGKVVSVLSLEVLDGVVQSIRGIVNPDKLQHLGVVSDLLRIHHGQDDHL